MRKTILFILLAISSITIAQTRLTPLSQSVQEIWGKNVFSGYYNDSVKSQVIFSPPFTPPFAIYVGKLWYLWYNKDYENAKYPLSVKDQDSVFYKMNTDSLTLTKLNALINYSVYTAHFVNELSYYDGLSCFFFHEGKGARAFPGADSNCARLMNTFEKIGIAVKKGDQKEIDALMPRVDSLILVYKALYPEDIFTEHKILWHESGNPPKKTMKPYVNLLTTDHLMSVDFVIPQSWYEEKSHEKSNKYAEKYAPIVKAVGRYLFQNTTLLDDGGIYIIIDDSLPRSIESGKNFILHEEDLTEEKLKNIITTRTLP